MSTLRALLDMLLVIIGRESVNSLPRVHDPNVAVVEVYAVLASTVPA